MAVIQVYPYILLYIYAAGRRRYCCTTRAQDQCIKRCTIFFNRSTSPPRVSPPAPASHHCARVATSPLVATPHRRITPSPKAPHPPRRPATPASAHSPGHPRLGPRRPTLSSSAHLALAFFFFSFSIDLRLSSSTAAAFACMGGACIGKGPWVRVRGSGYHGADLSLDPKVRGGVRGSGYHGADLSLDPKVRVRD